MKKSNRRIERLKVNMDGFTIGYEELPFKWKNYVIC
jgi:hypothetical protein